MRLARAMKKTRFLLLVACPMLLASCTLVQLREESREFYSATVLAGRVTPPPGWHGAVVVAAMSRERGRSQIAHRIWLHEPGGYELIVPAGKYTVVAYGDSDEDGSFDHDDPAALAASEIETTGTGIIMMLDLPLVYGQADIVRAAVPANASPVARHSTQVGAIADLDAPYFSAEQGRAGYWAPLESFRSAGGNIYFLEPYDPARIPVLFVHGAAGSAQDWRAFFERLDRTRYQAWFFQYPSGAALDSMSNLLYWKVLNLQLRYQFPRLHIVAHSMGGLVVRRFLLDHGAQLPQIRQFVTLSAPWGGEPAATLGVNHSPAVVPSWRDMQPLGPFMQRLFTQPLPKDVTHTLLFGHRGGYNLLRPTTDGTVTIASQLRPEAQSEARLVMGFDEDHVSILSAPNVVDQVTRALDADEVSASNSGSIRVSITHDSSPADSVSIDSLPTLVLTRHATDAASGRGPPTFLFLAPGHRSSVVGPIAPGVYEAQLLTPSFRATPSRHIVSVTRNAIAEVSFSVQPQGFLSGYVGADGDAYTYPAGSYRPPHPSVKIRSIVLSGPSGARTLVPRAADDAELWTSYAEGRDEAIGAAFSFVNLSEGDYRLEILAEGYEPHISQYRVRPGVTPPISPIVLTPADKGPVKARL